MRKVFLSAVSIAALMAGSAWAQSEATGQQAPTMPPASTAEQPAAKAPDASSSMTNESADTAATTAPSTEPEQAATEPETPPPSASSGTEVSADDLIGRDVYGQGDEEVGEVKDVILDPQSKEIRQVVIGVGGFLGLGEKTVAVDMDQIEIRPEEGIYVSSLTKESLEQMPEFDPDESTVSLDKKEPAAPAATTTSPAMPPTTGAAGQ